MKRKLKILIIAFLGILITNKLFSQEKKLTNLLIIKTLYPNAAKLNKVGQFVRKEKHKGVVGNEDLKTFVNKLIYYQEGEVKKATAILFTDIYQDGEKSSCHACTPIIDVLNFELKDGNWKKKIHIKNWEISQPGYGEGPKFQLKKYNNINCLYTKFNSFNNGQGEFLVMKYYNINDFKVVSEITKKISN